MESVIDLTMPKTLLERGLLETLVLQELRDVPGCSGAISVTIGPVPDARKGGPNWMPTEFAIAAGDPTQCRNALDAIVVMLARSYDLKA